MKKNLKKNSIIIFLCLIPSFVYAQTFRDFAVSTINLISGLLIPLLFAAALSFFIWGVADFIRAAENSEQRKKGKERILWGIIALFAMVGYLGLTSVITGTLFGTTTFLPQLFQ